MNKTIIIQNKEKYIELPFGREKSFDDGLCVGKNAGHSTKFSDDGAFIDDTNIGGQVVNFGSFAAEVFTENPKTYSVGDSGLLRIGSKDTNDIRVNGASAEIAIEGSKVIIHSGYVYRNGICCGSGQYRVFHGDSFYMPGCVCTHSCYLWVSRAFWWYDRNQKGLL